MLLMPIFPSQVKKYCISVGLISLCIANRHRLTVGNLLMWYVDSHTKRTTQGVNFIMRKQLKVFSPTMLFKANKAKQLMSKAERITQVICFSGSMQAFPNGFQATGTPASCRTWNVQSNKSRPPGGLRWYCSKPHFCCITVLIAFPLSACAYYS